MGKVSAGWQFRRRIAENYGLRRRKICARDRIRAALASRLRAEGAIRVAA